MTGRMTGQRAFGYPHTRATVAWVAGSMLLAGGTISIILSLMIPAYGCPDMLAAASVMVIAVGLACVTLPNRIPCALLSLVPSFGTVLICVAMMLTRTPTDGSELLLIWPVLFAGYFLRPLMAWAQVGGVLGAYTLVAVELFGRSGLAPAANLAGTSVFTLLIVSALRARIGELVAASHTEARTDGLTGLPNRRAFDETSAREIARCARGNGRLSLLIVDLDHFKQLNDIAGHPAGDAALRRVAKLLASQVRAADMLARLGGEEFALLLPDCPSHDAVHRAERIRATLAETSANWPDRVTVSIGISECPANGDSVADLLAAADQALYRAKSAGRNTVRKAPVRRPGCPPHTGSREGPVQPR